MPLWKQALLARLKMNKADDGLGGGGGGGGTDDKGGADKTPPEDKGGDKKPTDEEAKLIKEVMKRKEEAQALKAQLDQANGLKAQLDALGGLEALQALVKERQDAETKALEAKGDYERLKGKMAEAHAKEIDTLKAQVAEAGKAVEGLKAQLMEATVGSEFGQSSFIKDELLLTPSKTRALYGSHFDFVDGKVVGYDKPRGAASRTPLVDGAGVPVSFDAAMKAIIEADPEKDHVLKSKAKPGAGSDSNRGGSTPKKPEYSSGLDRISAGLAQLTKGQK
jgi:predicted RNase H-like nuclease (RuvC/YqgF family)